MSDPRSADKDRADRDRADRDRADRDRADKDGADRDRKQPVRRTAFVFAVGYAAFLAFMVFWPDATYASGSVDLGSRIVDQLGLGGIIDPQAIEFVANVVLFIPLTFLGGILSNRRSIALWVAVAFGGSTLVELSQLVFLSGRSATASDVVSNTLGGLVGITLLRSWSTP